MGAAGATGALGVTAGTATGATATGVVGVTAGGAIGAPAAVGTGAHFAFVSTPWRLLPLASIRRLPEPSSARYSASVSASGSKRCGGAKSAAYRADLETRSSLQ